MVSTCMAWGCYFHICFRRFSQGLYIRTWHTVPRFLFVESKTNKPIGTVGYGVIMNKTLKVTLFLLFGAVGIANAQSVERLADSTTLVEPKTIQDYDSLLNELAQTNAQLKSHFNLVEQERVQESIWKRKKYFKIGMMFPTVKYVEGEGDLSWKTDMAFMLQKGKTAYLHAEPIGGMVKIGLDWGLLGINYEKLKFKDEAEGILSVPSDCDDDDPLDFELDLGMHKIEYAPHIGPSVSVNPWKHLIASAYFHIMPTASCILENSNFSYGFGCVMAAGVSVAYKGISLGFEGAWSTIKYTQTSIEDDDDRGDYEYDSDFGYDDPWDSSVSDSMFRTEKFKLKTSCPRIYLSIRW